MSKPELCPDCGRDLDALGEYRDWIHYVPGTKWACLGEPINSRLREIVTLTYPIDCINMQKTLKTGQ